MNGPEDVARAIADTLRAAMPAATAAVAAAVGASEADVPPPALVTEQERDVPDLSEWPALFVVVGRLEGLRRVDGPDELGQVIYRARYPVRVFIFVRVSAGTRNGYEAVDLLRKRYVRAVRDVLFAVQETTRLDELTYTESYSDVETDANKRAIAAAYAEAVVEVDETLTPAVPATLAPDPAGWTVELTETLLPHPALD
jgi:hypothetical protein